ncbi:MULTISPECIES: LPS export ABC transporter permease LptG [Ramlibacter]|uniref:LPS export ABC transporter permease LptG n=1 Tax=Ramlibacter pinisoli TaxID=2682844 RepID=A0A6N8IXU7_9BURK|nr:MULTISPECIES: LPS export ABC transporter permease LptG [Ramlibacter]MBA2960866.1 LPS export ABC transporter permease LptG [Ramlibacter sp. CGMCC 1.13660]MVQ30813.1 LPS export ABC transporter permease LptG [Ramlibacter pinisoli]
MRTIRRLIYREVLASVLFVAAGFLALFFFFDFVDELPNVGKGVTPYRLTQALLYITLMVPSHLYELMPIAVLIGTIFVMSRLAQSSEYTILRTSGLGPGRALRTLMALGAAFTLITFATGDYLAPAADRAGQLLRARYQGRISIGQTGAWLKERQAQSTYNVNVGALSADGAMQGVRIFEADERGYLVTMLQAPTAAFAEGAWVLKDAERTRFDTSGARARVERSMFPRLEWRTDISPEMVSVALLKPDRMSTLDLFQYIQHLEANGQTSQRYEIEFWRKVFYPLSCLVMVVLALPFAYLHFRSGGITTYVFGGVLIGISFFLLNNVFGYAGNLRNWSPWLTAAAPGLIYTVLSLAAFSWLVLRR